MTLDEVKDRVPSNVTIFRNIVGNDVLVDGFCAGFLHDTPEGMYFRTWIPNWDDCSRLSIFLSHFNFELLFTIKKPKSAYRVYRLIE